MNREQNANATRRSQSHKNVTAREQWQKLETNLPKSFQVFTIRIKTCPILFLGFFCVNFLCFEPKFSFWRTWSLDRKSALDSWISFLCSQAQTPILILWFGVRTKQKTTVKTNHYLWRYEGKKPLKDPTAACRETTNILEVTETVTDAHFCSVE